MHDAAHATLVHMDWRPIVGLGPTPSARDPIERVLTLAVAQRAAELRKDELDYSAWRTAKYLAEGR